MDKVSLFRDKLKNIHTVLMQAYENTRGFTTPVQGDEREVVIRELLELVLPQSYRLGKGAIIDARGNQTGQVDAVFEKPFSLSFPISSPTNRLYLADSVAATFEIKSDLYAQADQAIKKATEIKSLHRKMGQTQIQFSDEKYLPTFIIGFKGYTTVEGIYEKFLPNLARPDHINAVLVIDSGVFVARTPARVIDGQLVSGKWFNVEGEPEAAILCFLACLSEYLLHMEDRETDLLSYSALL